LSLNFPLHTSSITLSPSSFRNGDGLFGMFGIASRASHANVTSAVSLTALRVPSVSGS
jgi:hypothetical protein